MNNRDMTSTAATLFVGVGVGVVVGWMLRGRYRRQIRLPLQRNNSAELETNECPADTGECKMVLVVRNDLKMGKGKAAAQCAHAAVGAVTNLSAKNQELLYQWRMCGQPKVVVKTESQESLLELAQKARSLGLNASLIRDAGRTQIAPGSYTVLGVGPGPEELVNSVTGHLKLF